MGKVTFVMHSTFNRDRDRDRIRFRFRFRFKVRVGFILVKDRPGTDLSYYYIR